MQRKNVQRLVKSIPRSWLRFIDELIWLPASWLPGESVRKLLNRLRGVKIGKGGWIGHGTLLGNWPFLLTIGDNVIFADGVKILTHDTSFIVVGGKDLAGEVHIGNNVQIGANAIVFPGVRIGDNVVVGAGAVVRNDIPDNSVVVGVPARIICTIEEGLHRLEEKLKMEKYFPTL